MPKFKNVSGSELDVFKPEYAGGTRIDAGGVIEVPGTVVTSRPAPKKDEPAPEPLPVDAYLVDDRGEERTWPQALWELVDDKPAPAAAPVKEN